MSEQAGTRAQRRAAMADSRRLIRAGVWPEWRHTTFPRGTIGGRGWLYGITENYENRLYSVLVRFLDADGSGRVHLGISTLEGREPPWRDMQRIKSELFGLERIAVEVCPADDRIIDEADMYHLWVLPVGADLGFGLHPKDEAGWVV